jgi:hypothetical protein
MGAAYGKGKDDNALLGDWSVLANKKQRNAEFYTTDPKNGSHNIYTFIADISKLKEGTYTWNGTNWILEDDSKGDKK